MLTETMCVCKKALRDLDGKSQEKIEHLHFGLSQKISQYLVYNT